MVENLETALYYIDWKSVIIAIVVMALLIVGGHELWKNLKDVFGIEFKKDRERREEHELLIKNSNDIAKLAKHHEDDAQKLDKQFSDFMEEMRREIKQFTDNRIHDRAQSFQIQKELTDAQIAISNSVNNISGKIDELKQETNERFNSNEEKENKRVQADIKDRIAQYYRHYNTVKKISPMELEGLEDLIASYELHGGENSFVHSAVQKEMYTWESTSNN